MLWPSSGLQLRHTENTKSVCLNCNLDEGHSVEAEILVNFTYEEVRRAGIETTPHNVRQLAENFTL